MDFAFLPELFFRWQIITIVKIIMIMTDITTGTTSATLCKHSVLDEQIAGVSISLLLTII